VAVPDAWWTTAASFVPFFAPMPMPAPMAVGHAPAWQVGAAVVLMLAATCAMVRLAARIYARALMHGGDRLTWRAAARR
jgi:ABC-2 type transport system permease protein